MKLFLVADEICPTCYHRMDFKMRVRTYDRDGRAIEWVIIRQCPSCGHMTTQRDPDQSEKGGSIMTNRILMTKVAGVTFEGRQAYISQLVGNEPCKIVPEPTNQYDANALAVHVAFEGEVYHVGYIPKELAAQIAPHLEGEAVMATIDEITGGFLLTNGESAAWGLLLRIEIPGESLHEK